MFTHAWPTLSKVNSDTINVNTSAPATVPT